MQLCDGAACSKGLEATDAVWEESSEALPFADGRETMPSTTREKTNERHPTRYRQLLFCWTGCRGASKPRGHRDAMFGHTLLLQPSDTPRATRGRTPTLPIAHCDCVPIPSRQGNPFLHRKDKMHPTVPPQQRRLRGPLNELHLAALRGSTERIIALLSRGSINIDQCVPPGFTALMCAAQNGYAHIVGILLNGGADMYITVDGVFSALHIAAQNAIALIKAGAHIEAKTREGITPLHLAAQLGHSEVMSVLVDVGANVDCRMMDGATPLFVAAGKGHFDIVRELLRANADPLLTATRPSGAIAVPLDMAAASGHANVVRVLIMQRGINGCAGPGGGVYALRFAAEWEQVDIMIMLTNAGVVHTGQALVWAAANSEAAVKFLLQQRQREASPTGLDGYVNFCDPEGNTALLYHSIDFRTDEDGVPRISSPRVLQLLVDAGANTTLALRIRSGDFVSNYGTPLAYTNNRLRAKKLFIGEEKDATKDQLHRLEATRRLLLRVEAVRAVSWLWHSHVTIARASGKTEITTSTMTFPANRMQPALMLPILRRRRRGALLAPLLRWVEMAR